VSVLPPRAGCGFADSSLPRAIVVQLGGEPSRGNGCCHAPGTGARTIDRGPVRR
jgi:hypothetical protein